MWVCVIVAQSSFLSGGKPGREAKLLPLHFSTAPTTQCLAREAASTDEGLTISPLVNTDRKGGACRIMLQQFCRAIAVTASNGYSQLILHRLHYVRGTEQEAKDACRSHHSNNRWRPYQRGGYSWFNYSHISEGYTMFEQFRNGYYYHMP
jgi:hypothetical protein